METEKMEYDIALGGHVELPEHVQTYEFAASRLNDMRQLLKKDIRNPHSTQMLFQVLPIHMRRRAMSHHPNRVPRRYRQIHIAQMSKVGDPKTNKRPSRKFRRKPSNLVAEYLRRQRKHVWLETHIWHAKRFHMVEKWGYKLPQSSCEKTFRACYRASAKHCLLQDISYFGCIELKGRFEDITSGFRYLTSTKLGLTVGAKIFISGKREGCVHLFRKNQYPRGSLGALTFLWRPPTESQQHTRTLWVFVHPTAYKEVLLELISVFELVNVQSKPIPITDESEMTNRSKDKPQVFMTKNYAYTQTPKYINESTKLTLIELKDTMNRFRLTGPLSQSVLSHALKCKSVEVTKESNWFTESISSECKRLAHQKQSEFWSLCSSLNSPSHLMPNLVLGLNVEDPRINRPSKRTKAIPAESSDPVDHSRFCEYPDELSTSELWEFELRNKICDNMKSTHELCELRNQHAIVPGERCIFEEELQPVPVLLIQRPGSQDSKYKRLGYGCGYDVIAPSGYGLPLWLCLVMWGARPGGLREMKSVSREAGREEFLPDSVSGLKEMSEQSIELRAKYFRLPPMKRCNYIKLGISSPFKCLFSQLISEWQQCPDSNLPNGCGFYVLREIELLEAIQKAMNRKGVLPNLPGDCLVPVYMKMKSRGTTDDFSIICLPKKEDFKRNFKQIRHFIRDPVYTEPQHPDVNEKIRKSSRLKHKQLLKRLRAKRVRVKRKLQEKAEKRVKIQTAGTEQLIKAQYKKMCELWLPEKPKSIRSQCNREVIGYITQGEFSFTEGTVASVGYIAAASLQSLLKVANKFEPNVLVRGTKSQSYRFASLKINCYL